MIMSLDQYKKNIKTVQHARAGFTMIELMIGLTIVGILAAGAFYGAMTVLEQTKRSTTQTTLQTITGSLMLYKTEKGQYPNTLQELSKFNNKPVPADGWDHKFVYKLTPEGKNPYELYSHGPQGKGGNKESRVYPRK